MVAMALVRATPLGNGGVQGKRVMQGLMALEAAKLFVAVEAEGLRSRGAVATGASRARAGLAQEEECEVAAFFQLYSSLREVPTPGVVARSASAVDGVVSLSGDAASAGETTERKYKKSKTKKAAKDSNQPKRPPTAYFIFMKTFRKEFHAANPDVKGVTASAKAGGQRWLSMSEEEKAPYVADAAVRKGQYEQAMAAYKAEHGAGTVALTTALTPKTRALRAKSRVFTPKTRALINKTRTLAAKTMALTMAWKALKVKLDGIIAFHSTAVQGSSSGEEEEDE